MLPVTQAKNRRWVEFKKNKYLFILSIPTILCLILFYYLPMYGLVIAFQDYKPFLGIMGSKWVGFDQFSRFFNYAFFWRILKNTLLLSVYNLLWGFPAPIILALLLNEVRNQKFKKFVQTVSYMPHFYSTVVVCGLVTMFLAPTGGLITRALSVFGISHNFLADARWFRTLYIASSLWQSTGWGTIIYLAALTNVDPQLYEAAYVDGASRWRCLWSITIPSIAPTIITLLIMNIGSMINVGFERAFLLQTPATYETSEIIATYVYKAGIVNNSFSYGSAVGLFNSVISLILIITANKISAKVSETSLW
ncbi:MAG: sugar ABC transporter permease [Oscillospiraceae bacterium]|nr:sugar ABC transporter permease [Oscillospiraceae bacterium]